MATFNPLATDDQREIEALALELFETAPVRDAITRQRGVMQASLTVSSAAAGAVTSVAASAAGRATLEQNLHEWAFSACFKVAAMQPARPRVACTINLPHRWFGHAVPGTRHGVDNPDNIYRVIAVAPGARYAIHGQVLGRPGADVSFTVFSAYPGDGADSHSLGVITLDEIERDGEGRFTLTLDDPPAAGRRNHLSLHADARLVFVRYSLLDWANETPLALAVELLSPPPSADAPVDAQAAARAVERVVPYWTASMPKWFGRHPMNVVPLATQSNFAYAKQANVGAQWQLAPDQALCFTLDAQGAAYLGVQLADPWGASPDYAAH